MVFDIYGFQCYKVQFLRYKVQGLRILVLVLIFSSVNVVDMSGLTMVLGSLLVSSFVGSGGLYWRFVQILDIVVVPGLGFYCLGMNVFIFQSSRFGFGFSGQNLGLPWIEVQGLACSVQLVLGVQVLRLKFRVYSVSVQGWGFHLRLYANANCSKNLSGKFIGNYIWGLRVYGLVFTPTDFRNLKPETFKPYIVQERSLKTQAKSRLRQ